MTTFTVTSTADTGEGSLRAAVTSAQNADTIVFDPSLANETITLASTISVSKGITIDGTGSNITVSGGNSTSIFDIEDSSNTTNTIRGLIIADGKSTGIRGTNGTGEVGMPGAPGGPGGAAAGGVFIGQGSVKLENDAFRHDVATGGNGGEDFASPGAGGAAAGAIFVAAGANVTLTGDQFSNDMGTGGTGGSTGTSGAAGGEAAGAVYVQSGATVTPSNLQFSQDTGIGGLPGGAFAGSRSNGYADSNSKTVANAVACFCTGTLIRVVSDGREVDVAVEHLAAGDLVVTASGALRPIRWLGHRAMRPTEHVEPWTVHPVRVRAGAFGPAMPARDLCLSPGHPVLVGADADHEGGHLVPAMCLINGTTVARIVVETVTYWHVELDTHDILLAEGLPAESYLDGGDRAFFSEALLHALASPDFVVPGLAGRCRPVAVGGPVIERELRRLDAVFTDMLAAHAAWGAEVAYG